MQASVSVVDLELDPVGGNVVIQWEVTSGGGAAVEAGVTCIDGQGDEVWSWVPGPSGAAGEPFGMVLGQGGEVLVAMGESASQSRRLTLTGLDLGTGAILRSGTLDGVVPTAPGGFEAWPDGTARIVVRAWPAGPSLVTLDGALVVTSQTSLRSAPPGPNAPQTTIATATSDGWDGLLLTGLDWHPGGANPGNTGFARSGSAGARSARPSAAPRWRTRLASPELSGPSGIRAWIATT